MNNKQTIKELIKLAKIIIGAKNPLDGMNKRKALNFVNETINFFTHGIFHDDSWNPVHAIFYKLKYEHINYNITDTQYKHDGKGRPNSKTWKFEIDFKDDKEKDQVLYGTIIALGAGSVEDPLDKYDLVAYVS